VLGFMYVHSTRLDSALQVMLDSHTASLRLVNRIRAGKSFPGKKQIEGRGSEVTHIM
jgi:hypothetical protein